MELNLFVSTFALIFVAELPDKTAFAALLLATCHHPLAVFTGAAAAFVIQSLVAVAFGSLFSLLPPMLIHIGAGILFLVFAIMMWRKKESSGEDVKCDQQANKARFSKSVASTFMTIFIAEWGDLTQLATATLAAKYHSPITIFCSATLALWAVTAIAVIVGYKAKHIIEQNLLQRVAATAFAVVGIGLLVKH
ncbi:MAG: TMEM165/GDT1 family protein [Nostoc sp. NMS7]|uniref:TMEM165/GDT1 family protein n=1 Tax=Nostoc sp. NMS7 TaxID=2815391 RepID=UPI0025EB2A12|nr:TMEM165/GDT1 family protein [Nostoc sp. NMS7]MBN3947035.1 TMEM165/GDT1 family protein [Nostoc sp. NMS7]